MTTDQKSYVRQRLAAKKSDQVAPLRVLEPPEPVKHAENADTPPGSITYSCRHRGSNIPCGACRAAKAKERGAKKRAKLGLPEQKSGGNPPRHRLPHDSQFVVNYDEERIMWTGTLTILGLGVFSGEESGVFRLLSKLDDQYQQRKRIGLTETGQSAILSHDAEQSIGL